MITSAVQTKSLAKMFRRAIHLIINFSAPKLSSSAGVNSFPGHLKLAQSIDYVLITNGNNFRLLSLANVQSICFVLIINKHLAARAEFYERQSRFCMKHKHA
jgi:hypothetical protein